MMRLDAISITTIKREVADTLGNDARVRLFGSRLDDTRKGGDVDLLVELDRPVDNAIMTACRLEARLIRALDGRKVDVILDAPNVPEQSIHRIARAEGVLL
jgi:predicted nucleotidyltransferase